jgi:hypothetical protein
VDVQHVKNLLFAVYSLEYVALVAYNLVLWLFAMKYWVVSKKVEIFQAEIRLETQPQTFDLVLKGGVVFFTLLTTISVIPEYFVLADADFSRARAVWLSTVSLLAGEIIVIFISLCFLVDGFIRVRKSIQEGEVICKKGIVSVLTVYFLQMVQCIGFLVAYSAPGQDFNESHPLFSPIFIILFRFFFCVATTILASILYKLGEQQAAAKNLKESFV